MKVVCFEPGYNEKHRRVLRALADGIPGAVVRPVTEYEPCDIAVVFGAVKRSYKPTWSKQAIYDRHSGRRLIVVESAFVKRGEYFAVGWGGFAGHADFRSEGMPQDRWKALGIKRLKWKDKPEGNVVVCGQLPRDTQVQDVDHIAWCQSTVATLLAAGHTVRFRPHPKIKDPAVYGIDADLFDTRKIRFCLDDARCVVTWNSTTGVDAGIRGIPVVACDDGSMAWPIAAHGIEGVDSLIFPDRTAWLAGIGYSQWTPEEMAAGLTWRHLTR